MSNDGSTTADSQSSRDRTEIPHDTDGPAVDVSARDKSREGDILQERVKKTTGLAGRVFNAPPPKVTFLLIIILPFIFGLIALFDLEAAKENFMEEFFSAGIIFGFVMMAVPAIIASITVAPLANDFGGNFTSKRTMLMALASIGMIGVILIFTRILSLFIAVDYILAMALGYAWAFSIQLSILMLVSNPNYLSSLAPASIQSVVGLAAIFACHPWVVPGYVIDLSWILIVIFFIVIFIGMTMAWILYATSPFRKNFGVDGLTIAQQSFQHFSEGTGEVTEIERFFSGFGKPARVTAGLMAFRRVGPKVSGTSRKYKAVIIVPDVHKGPFGHLAGSNMPVKVYHELKKYSEHVLVPHGSATHDLNPVNDSETRRFGKALKDALKSLKKDQFSSRVSKIIRVKGSENVTISLQYLGDAPVGTVTSSPYPTDDLEHHIGRRARKLMRRDDSSAEPVLIDAHNCMIAGEGYVHNSSPKSRAIIDTMREAVRDAKDLRRGKDLKIGLAEKHGYNAERHGLGPMGIQVMAVRARPDETYAYILFDGNNLEPGLREKIITRLTDNGLVDDVEVLTSDNHIVNMTLGGYAPVGEKLDHAELLSDLERLVKKAVKDLEAVKAASISVKLDNLKVFGEGNTLKLTSTINDSVLFMEKGFFIFYGSAFGLSFLIMKFLL